MKLTLDREDLLPQYKDVNCSRTVFTMFKPDVQDAINVVGRAQFREYDGGNYNAIYPQQNNESQ